MSSSASLPVSRPRRWWPWIVLIGLLLLVVLRGLVVETFSVPSASMSPTLHVGDRIVVWKPGAHDLHRGDLIVFDGDGVFAQSPPAPGGLAGAVRSVGTVLGVRVGETDYVKRVIGLPGDHLQVGSDGVLMVNGAAVDENYLPAGTSSSATAFDIRVPAGRIFVMGDNRIASDDSRNHLGDPGGGTVPEDQVIGTVTWRYWPLGSWGTLR
ncbi:signal peptidase I [Branchiibius cervicis]|uniref:Signal peptidase I n=1 Tax=Branchiibius cervicis TaxID=908252 RepID=A0ABW2AV91_9MICO